METMNRSDAEISAEIAAYQKKARLGRLILGAGIAIAAVGFIVQTMFVTISGVIVAMVGSAVSAKAAKGIKEVAGSSILKLALEDVFDDVQYDPFSGISYSDVNDSGFGFSYDEIETNDHVQAKYKGLNIEMSDVKLVSVSVDEDGHENRTVVFQGMWLICDFGKELSADVRLMERGKLGKMLGKGGIKTDNEQFNKQFRIDSNDAEEVFYILTPHMMEYIVQMDAKADARTNISFMRGGRMHVALNSGRDAFEVGRKVSDAAKIKEQFVEEISQVTDLIDELRLTDGIFKGSAD